MFGHGPMSPPTGGESNPAEVAHAEMYRDVAQARAAMTPDEVTP